MHRQHTYEHMYTSSPIKQCTLYILSGINMNIDEVCNCLAGLRDIDDTKFSTDIHIDSVRPLASIYRIFLLIFDE